MHQPDRLVLRRRLAVERLQHVRHRGAGLEVLEAVHVEAGGMRQQHAQRHLRRGIAAERRNLPRTQVGADVAIEIEPALRHEPQRHAGRHHLAHRADREQRVGVDLLRRAGFAQAVAGRVHDFAVAQNGHCDAGHTVVPHALGQRPCRRRLVGAQHVRTQNALEAARGLRAVGGARRCDRDQQRESGGQRMKPDRLHLEFPRPKAVFRPGCRAARNGRNLNVST